MRLGSVRGKYAMLKCEGRWAERIEELLAASDASRGFATPRPRKELAKAEGACPVCGTAFQIIRSSKKFCSQLCREKARYRAMRAEVKPTPVHCGQCQGAITVNKAGRPPKYCGATCRAKAWKKSRVR